VIRRLIGKWLKAGVLEQGCLSEVDEGTPQGGVISPMLSNIFLHEVLDTWFANVVKPRLKGRAFMIRYADDFVVGFEREDDARRVLDVLPKRFEKYGLKLHPTKTRLVAFSPRRQVAGGGGKEEESTSFEVASRRLTALTPSGQPVGWLSRSARLWASPITGGSRGRDGP
jgi:RNA-directed DNA polymerase